MPYIDRNELNEISGVFSREQYDGQEYIEDIYGDLGIAIKDKQNKAEEFYNAKKTYKVKVFTGTKEAYFDNTHLTRAMIFESSQTVWDIETVDFEILPVLIPVGTCAGLLQKEVLNRSLKMKHLNNIGLLDTIEKIEGYDFKKEIDGNKINNDTIEIDVTSWLQEA